MTKTVRMGDQGAAVKKLQIQVNKTFANRSFPWRKIKTDGIFGEDTQKAARFAGWLMGFARPQLKKIDEGEISAWAYKILVRQNKPSDSIKERDLKRRPVAKKLRFLHEHRARKLRKRGVGTFDDVPVAAWMVKFLKKSRANGWQGELVSGFRSPEHSEQLCQDMCGQPTCPGRCAGRGSRHVGLIHPAGAIDITDTDRFAEIQPKIGSPLHNDLPNDPVHFSVTGH
jgi:hypothetical protein